jgi:hypothetical protein
MGAACAPWQAAPAVLVPAAAPVAGVLVPAVPAADDAGAAAAEVEPAGGAEDVACPPVDASVPVPHPAATSEAAARPKNRVRMPFRRRNRPRGCARRPALGVTHTMIKDNSNRRRV